MELALERLFSDLTLTEANEFISSFETFGESKVSADEQNRILSSVMRKAGFEMKDTTKIKQTKRHSKRLIGFIIAAAIVCLCGFTAYTVYKYNYGNAFSSRVGDDFEYIKGDVHDLESTTQLFDGEILVNTFDDIDFTIECVVSDIISDYVVVTARKKDGTPFAEDDKVRFAAGLGMTIPCIDDTEIPDTTQLLWTGEEHNIELNNDGSLSITLSSWFKYGNEDYDVILGFGDIFSYENPWVDENNINEALDKKYTEFLNSGIDLGGSSYYYFNKDEVGGDFEEYSKQLEAHKRFYNEMAEDIYEGTFIIKAHIAVNGFIIPPEETECSMKIELSGMTCMFFGDQEQFISFIDADADSKNVDVDITFKIENNKDYTVRSTFDLYNATEFYGETAGAYIHLPQFTDPYAVEEILLNGKTLWKK